MPLTYRMRADHGAFKKGQLVYPLRGPDYGLAGDDTRLTGEPHRSVTASPSGDYPSGTVPTRLLEVIVEG